ncbi:hypothetical protein SDC9_122908 [bioreactor metagenome]|uniref:Uncharacterized protein n=1 Tax=bioreactor metagenome TaxID=1076179 RepID=A0A645CG81_9ZZZZ
MPPAMIRALAGRAGIHVYSDSDCFLEVNSRYLSLHNEAERRRVAIRLPRPARRVVDLFDGTVYVENRNELVMDLEPYATVVAEIEYETTAL